MKGSESGEGKVFGRFTEPAHRVLDLAREEAERCGHRYRGPEHVLVRGSRRHRQVAAHVGLPDGYQGAAGLLLAALQVDPDRLRDTVAVELGGIRP
jgi:hypothetical protein